MGVRWVLSPTPTYRHPFIHRGFERLWWVLGRFSQKNYFCTKTGIASMVKMKKLPLFLFSPLTLRYLCSANRWKEECTIYIKAFTWRFVLDSSNLATSISVKDKASWSRRNRHLKTTTGSRNKVGRSRANDSQTSWRTTMAYGFPQNCSTLSALFPYCQS